MYNRERLARLAELDAQFKELMKALETTPIPDRRPLIEQIRRLTDEILKTMSERKVERP